MPKIKSEVLQKTGEPVEAKKPVEKVKITLLRNVFLTKDKTVAGTELEVTWEAARRYIKQGAAEFS